MTNDQIPTWVIKRDGRREPFEADKISQALFAATETQGAANAFLARELTDSVLHFLAAEHRGEAVATAQLAELVEKVVRELGQPVLARAYARQRAEPTPRADRQRVRIAIPHLLALDAGPEGAVAAALTAYALHAVFGRDLAAAHGEGLLQLGGLEHPGQLACAVVEGTPHLAESFWEAAAAQVSRGPAPCLVVDGTEWFTAASTEAWLRAFAWAVAAVRKTAILNLNQTAPPRWAQPSAQGPLFAASAAPLPATATERTWRTVQTLAASWLRVDWHLSGADFDEPGRRTLLEEVVQTLGDVHFVFDRPRQPVQLAEGLERDVPAVLMAVGLGVSRLLERPEVAGDAERFFAKLPSLVRMAVRAGVQKRAYLRRQASELTRGFLLDRARLVLRPCDLDETVRTLLGAGAADSPRSLELARRIVQAIADTAALESRATGLDIVVGAALLEPQAAAPAAQLATAGALHRSARHSAAPVWIAASTPAAQRVEWLHEAWRAADLARVRFVTR